MPVLTGTGNSQRCFLSAKFLVLGELAINVKIGKVMQKSPWQPFRWQVLEMGPADISMSQGPDELVQTVKAEVYQDQLQGYFLNLDTEIPYIFFCVRYPEDDKTRMPSVFEATLSYDEAARWMDSNEEVQTLPLPAPVASWLAELVQAKYQPETKQRRRPQSFVKPGERR
ncbi:MAG: hypothetical protein A0129_06555 [Limnobacter sp. CACIAM 66H1]|nr:MAG: hypothetical protein A0129_06555 [Limnobacter sp. CACIAM 66H1]